MVSFKAEAIAMENGLEHYLNPDRVPVVLETDSLTLKKILEGE